MEASAAFYFELVRYLYKLESVHCRANDHHHHLKRCSISYSNPIIISIVSTLLHVYPFFRNHNVVDVHVNFFNKEVCIVG